MDTIENLIWRDNISALLKNNYKKIDLDELDRYEEWDIEDFNNIDDEEMRIWQRLITI